MSTYYEERMDADLEEIRSKVRKVSDLVDTQLERATDALFAGDRELGAEVVIGDRQVNRRVAQIDDLCHAFIVRHAPSERYLRRVSSVLRFGVALERIGDYASSIAREVGRVSGPPPEQLAEDLRFVADRARQTLSEGLQAFHTNDPDAGPATLPATDAHIEELFTLLFGLADEGEVALADAFAFAHVLNLLMRVGEQAQNIHEQAEFAVSGEVPEHGPFRVLFVDAENSGVGKLAEACARSLYPVSGRYESAGWSAAVAVDTRVSAFLEAEGLEVADASPVPLEQALSGSEPWNVVVLVDPAGRDRFQLLPFRTTLVVWDVPGGLDDVEALYRAIRSRVGELMTTLAGLEAA